MKAMRNFNWFFARGGLLLCLLAYSTPAHAQFGGGAQVVFDPSMYARQFQQLQQQAAAVTSLAQQLRYMIINTTGGGGACGNPIRPCSQIWAT